MSSPFAKDQTLPRAPNRTHSTINGLAGSDIDFLNSKWVDATHRDWGLWRVRPISAGHDGFRGARIHRIVFEARWTANIACVRVAKDSYECRLVEASNDVRAFSGLVIFLERLVAFLRSPFSLLKKVFLSLISLVLFLEGFVAFFKGLALFIEGLLLLI